MAEYSEMTPAERDVYCAEAAQKFRERQAARSQAKDTFSADDELIYSDAQREKPAHIRDEQEAIAGLAELATLATEQRPLRRASPPAESFPLDAIGTVLGGAARAIVDKVQCADAVAASSVLAMASLAAQPHADVVIPATGNARPLSLFIVSVAATGDRKSAADHEAGLPMREREKRLREQYEIDAKDYRHAKRAYDAAISKAEKTSGGRAAIEAALHGVGEEPTAPRLPILTTDEPTIEGLVKLFACGQSSLGLFSDEGGAFLGGHALSNENRLRTLASLSSIWDGSPIRRIRAGDGATILPGRRLALHLMLQPAASAGLLSDPIAADQGLLSRILVCSPSSTAGSRFQKPLAPTTEPALKAYRDGLRALLEKPPKLIDGTAAALDPRHLPFSSAAAAAWRRLVDEIERKLAPGGVYEPIRGFANKLGEHIARMAGVLALVDDTAAREISFDVLGRAAALGDFYAGEALRLFDAGHVSPEIAHAEKLLLWLQTSWPDRLIALAPIYQLGPNSMREAKTARSAVTVLEEHGYLTKLSGGNHDVGGKRFREAWRINGRDS